MSQKNDAIRTDSISPLATATNSELIVELESRCDGLIVAYAPTIEAGDSHTFCGGERLVARGLMIDLQRDVLAFGNKP